MHIHTTLKICAFEMLAVLYVVFSDASISHTQFSKHTVFFLAHQTPLCPMSIL